MPDDPRFTFGLIHDVLQVLKEHGYHFPEGHEERNQARGQVVLAVADLCRAYEGHDAPTGGAS